MGAAFGFSAAVSTQISNQYISAVTSVVTSAVTTARGRSVNATNVQVSICPPECNIKFANTCAPRNINISAANGTQYTISASTFQNVIINVKNDLKQSLQQVAKTIASSASQSSWFQTAFGFSITDSTQVNNLIEQISTYVTTSASTSCDSVLFSSIDINLLVCGITNDVNVNSNNDVVSAVGCVTQQAQNFFLENKAYQQGIVNADTEAAAADGGYGILQYIIIAVLVFVLILIFMGFYTAVKGNTTTTTVPPPGYGPPPPGFSPQGFRGPPPGIRQPQPGFRPPTNFRQEIPSVKTIEGAGPFARVSYPPR